MVGSLSSGSNSSLVSSYRTATPFDHLTRGFSSETPLSMAGLIENENGHTILSDRASFVYFSRAETVISFCSSKYAKASIAALQPSPAAVTA